MTTEPSQLEAKQQYFELRTLLNQANPQRNLMTELEFELRENENEFFIIIKCSSARHGLRLAYKQKTRGRWLIAGNILFEDFIKYMFKKISVLNDFDQREVCTELTSWLARLWVIELKQ